MSTLAPLPEQLLLDLVGEAVRAPSSHNTQPWRFRLLPDGVALYADRTRALPVNDPRDRELTISCGAALFNLRVAAAARGYAPEITLLGDDPDLLATVRLDEGTPPDEQLLADAIEARWTTRAELDDRPLAPAMQAAIHRAVAAEGAWIEPIVGPCREEVAELIEEGDRAQLADVRWRRELAAWLHPRRRGDGLVVPGLVAPIARAAVRSVDLGRRTGRQDAQLARSAPWLVVLGTSDDDERAWLEVGQALQRMLLIAAQEGVQAGYLNQPCQLDELRPRLADLLDHDDAPQLCLRLGHPAAEPARSPRRPVAAVIDSDQPSAPSSSSLSS